MSHADLSRDPLGTVTTVADTIGLERQRSGEAAMSDYAAAHRRTPRIHVLTEEDGRFLDGQRGLVRRLGYREPDGRTPGPAALEIAS